MAIWRESGRDQSRLIDRVRNSVVVIVLLVTILTPCATLVAKRAGVQFPLWFDGATARYLSGEAEPVLPDGVSALVRAFMDGELQKTLESVMLDATPFRAEALIANAELQRSAIRASNLLFRWPAYPCFYGAGNYVVDEYEAIKPVQRTALVPGIERFAEGLANFAKEHPEDRFGLVLPAESTDPFANPAIALTSDGISTNDVAVVFERAFAGIDNLSFAVQDYESGDAYYQDYYRYDHHWNALGAIDAYNKLAQTMGFNALEVRGYQEFDGTYLGSLSRQGLMAGEDPIGDVTNDFSSEIIRTNAGLTHPETDHAEYDNMTPIQKLTLFYGAYFDGVGVDITNPEAPFSDSVLVVSDSFGGAFTRLVATEFQTVHAIDWLTQEMSGNETLSEAMAKDDARTVIFVGTSWNYATMLDRYPRLFS